MNYAALNIVVRRRLDDMSARSFSLQDVAASIDGAAKEMQNRLALDYHLILNHYLHIQ